MIEGTSLTSIGNSIWKPEQELIVVEYEIFGNPWKPMQVLAFFWRDFAGVQPELWINANKPVL